MRDSDCNDLLRWAAAELGLRFEGFRRVRGQVCKRLARRIVGLDLRGPGAYRQFVAAHPEERGVLEELCRVHVSRFYRDRAVFDALRDQVLPALARAAPGGVLRVWSAGCAGGEEPYTLALIWHFAWSAGFPGVRLEIVATDSDPASLDRARRGCYPRASLKELPREWQETAFTVRDRWWCLREELRQPVTLQCEDLRTQLPGGLFQLILCRNLAFTYFAEAVQREVAARLASRLAPGGALLIGAREQLPDRATTLVPDTTVRGLYLHC